MGDSFRYRKAVRHWFVILLLLAAAVSVVVRFASIAAAGAPSPVAATSGTERGRILDRNGVVLALDSPLYNVAVWKPDTDPATFPGDASRLAAIVGTPDSEILARWRSSTTDFFYVRKRIAPRIAKQVQEIKADGGFRGITVERVAGRFYPEGRLAAHLVGFVGDDNRGLAGVEFKYDEVLAAPADASRDADGRPALPRGKDVYLTIDADVQFLLEDVARRAFRENGAESIMLLAADVRTGEILAYVSLPDFDPNAYRSFPAETWRDLPATYTYEPGSVFKIFSLASILDLGGITPSTTFDCGPEYSMVTASGERIVIRDLATYGRLDLEGILAHSSNVGTGYASDRVEAIDLYERLRSFGFGARTGIALSGEEPGSLKDPVDWSLRSKPTIAIGQEVTVTAVQMVSAAGAIANGGVLLKPYVIHSVRDADGVPVYRNGPQPVRQVIAPATSAAILKAMERAAGMSGTGWRAKADDLGMAVKTGTAQMYDPREKRYSEKDFIASTMAVLPARDPRVAIYVAIVKPRGEQYLGGRVAAPVVRDAVDALLSVMDIPRDSTETVLHPGTVAIRAASPPVVGDVMPDLRGTPKRLLLPLLGRKDISVRIRGNGYVYRQSPAPGTPLTGGSAITLDLR